jgi:hypothetical protein
MPDYLLRKNSQNNNFAWDISDDELGKALILSLESSSIGNTVELLIRRNN